MARLQKVHARPGAPMDVREVAALFKLLGDPSRLAILDQLVHGDRCVSDLAGAVGMSESATSHQLRLLRAARLVRARRDGRLAIYALDDAHVVRLLKDASAHAGHAAHGGHAGHAGHASHATQTGERR
ncbi:MAG: helix-turn-helix transcriptional regulator [Acidobacteria bacterium]|nr:helix-turn-helix transcriptional regulator [Acidobacteriota bacterium]